MRTKPNTPKSGEVSLAAHLEHELTDGRMVEVRFTVKTSWSSEEEGVMTEHELESLDLILFEDTNELLEFDLASTLVRRELVEAVDAFLKVYEPEYEDHDEPPDDDDDDVD